MTSVNHSFPVLYKYLSRRFADCALIEGKLRIGTLSEFRCSEAYGEERGDAGEGSLTRYIKGNIVGNLSSAQASVLPRGLVIKDCYMSNVNRAVVVESRVPDMFIYCISSARNAKLLKAFNADVCLEIRDGAAFFNALGRQVARKGGQWGVAGECVYGQREFAHDERPTECLPFLLKPPSHAHQCEFRMAWATTSGKAESFIAECPEATVLMKPVSVE